MAIGRTGTAVTFEASASFPGDPHTPGRARAWALARIREGLHGADDMLLDDAALVLSELVTNALRAGGTSVTVHLQVWPGRLRLAVGDSGPGRPRLRSPGIYETSGRGLQVVAALADEWGVTEFDHDGGKEVWAELALIRARAM
jgi:anti-sigma regulatory factor (Ser/Thr protein kinase)